MSAPRVKLVGPACAALTLIALWACANARSAEPISADRAPAPKFHRSYVPADQIEKRTWTQGYLPIDAKEFRQLVDAVHAGEIVRPAPAPRRSSDLNTPRDSPETIC